MNESILIPGSESFLFEKPSRQGAMLGWLIDLSASDGQGEDQELEEFSDHLLAVRLTFC